MRDLVNTDATPWGGGLKIFVKGGTGSPPSSPYLTALGLVSEAGVYMF